MKHWKLILFMTFLIPSFGHAQEINDYSSIWKRSKFFNIGYVSSTITPQNMDGKKSNFGAALVLGNTYFLHSKPIAGMVKIGLDAIWFDINYVNYEKGSFKLPNFSGIDDWKDYPWDNGWEDYEDETDLNLGWHKLDIGMGIGPSVHVSPLSFLNNSARDLRVSLYFHFTPSATALIVSDSDDTNVHYGFSPVFNFGGAIQWKAIGFGVEGRWCTAKFNSISTMEIYDPITDETYSGHSKSKFKTSSSRVFLRFNF